MEAGRKFVAMLLFLGLSAVEVIVAMVLHLPVPDGPISVQGGVVMAFIAGNAAVSWAWAGKSEATKTESRTVTEQVRREIQERRALHDDGTEDTP